MISCIICSRQPDISDELKENIATTIGCDYELVVIDNSHNHYSIFSAYNEGVRRAKGDILCFMHEDILFRSNDWGGIVTSFFSEHSGFGVIGVIGGYVLPDTPTSYWEAGLLCGRFIQGYIENGKYKTRIDEPEWSEPYKECASVDGLWMCVPKKLFDKNALIWDIDTYNHFHCYDLDICMQAVVNGYKVGVVNNVVIEHKSCGNMNDIYQTQNNLWYEKWCAELPIIKGCNISELELSLRTQIVIDKRISLTQINHLNRDLDSLRTSHAYRLGKTLLRPFSWIKRKILNHQSI